MGRQIPTVRYDCPTCDCPNPGVPLNSPNPGEDDGRTLFRISGCTGHAGTTVTRLFPVQSKPIGLDLRWSKTAPSWPPALQVLLYLPYEEPEWPDLPDRSAAPESVLISGNFLATCSSGAGLASRFTCPGWAGASNHRSRRSLCLGGRRSWRFGTVQLSYGWLLTNPNCFGSRGCTRQWFQMT